MHIFHLKGSNVEFEWDETKRRSNIEKHHIDFLDAVSIFDHDVLTAPDERKAYAEQRHIAVGLMHGIEIVLVYMGSESESFRRGEQTGMKEKTTRPPSRQRKQANSDLKRLRKMKDTDIDYSDIPELDEDFWARAELYTRPKESISVRIDADVMEWLRSKGKGYQTRMNAILRAVMDQERGKR